MNATLLKENEDLKRQVAEMEQRLKKRMHQFENQKDQLSQEQQIILMRLEEERNKSIENHTHHFEIKLQNLQAVNDQLTQKLSLEQDQH